MIRRHSGTLAMVAVLLAAAACAPSPDDSPLANNADTMDHNMAIKAKQLESMAEDSSNAMADTMMNDAEADINASAQDPVANDAGPADNSAP